MWKILEASRNSRNFLTNLIMTKHFAGPGKPDTGFILVTALASVPFIEIGYSLAVDDEIS